MPGSKLIRNHIRNLLEYRRLIPLATQLSRHGQNLHKYNKKHGHHQPHINQRGPFRHGQQLLLNAINDIIVDRPQIVVEHFDHFDELLVGGEFVGVEVL
jgi:hypothetical protein